MKLSHCCPAAARWHHAAALNSIIRQRGVRGLKTPRVQPPILPATHCLFGAKLQIQRIIAMRPSNFVSCAAFFSSDPAMASAPGPTSQRTIHGSAMAASVRSLPDPGAFSGPLAAPASAAAAAAPSHSSRSSTASTAAGAAQMQILQRRAPEGQLLPPQAANTRPCSRSGPPRLGHAAAAVAAVIFACSVASSFALQYAVGTWTTAALSQARYALAATSLPNAGVAIFAGGQCTSCDFCLRCFRMGMGVRGMRELGGCVFVFDVCVSHALCSGQQCLLQCCGHLQREGGNLEHRSSQPGSMVSCSHVAAECRSRDLRWWRRYVL
jgi:hypothetical protein